MVVRIHNVGKWAVLKAGDMLELNGVEGRRIRVEFNCPAPTRIDAIEGDKATFLAVVQGHEVVEFVAGAQVHLVATSEDEVWYFTNDGQEVAAVRPEAVSFTKIASRRARNPELERMMFKMEQNMQRRMDAQFAELEAMREAMAEREGADPETGELPDENGDGPADGTAGEDAGAAGGGVESTEPGPGTDTGAPA